MPQIIRTRFSEDQYIKFRALIIEDFGPQEWEKASKRRRIKIVRKTMELFRTSPWWARLMTECPPDADGYWRPRLKDDEGDKLTAELEVLVAKMRIAKDEGTSEEKLELMEALYRLMRRMNGKSAYGDD